MGRTKADLLTKALSLGIEGLSVKSSYKEIVNALKLFKKGDRDGDGEPDKLIDRVKAVLGKLFYIDKKEINGKAYYAIFFKPVMKRKKVVKGLKVLKGQNGYLPSKAFDKVALDITSGDRWKVHANTDIRKKGTVKRIIDNAKNKENARKEEN